ncbi:MAG: RluA family pseudouridine synthase, partial [Deltaproteobacteria bacterium]|nr:RluA family pseudouridine synthase [Deltaproteobacteria bacterium]
TARKLILSGRVRLNGHPVEPAHRLHSGDRLEYTIPPPVPVWVAPQAGALEVLFEDAWLLVINKPAGMPMHPGVGHRTGTLVNFLLHHCGDLSGIAGVLRPGIVHRLDKDTSGVVVVAKNDEAHLGLQAQFKARTTRRTYLALVVGVPPLNSGVVDQPLARENANRLRRAVVLEGKHARTHWQVERRLGPFTLLRLKLETGRTHQIRVHMAHEGWPLLGDPLYGKHRHRGLPLTPEVMARLEGFRRQALHAMELGFEHPHTGALMEFSSPLPTDMEEVLSLLSAQDWPRARIAR